MSKSDRRVVSATSPRATNLLLNDDDFLSEHLGQLLVRQPISPKTKTTPSLPFDFTTVSRRTSLAKNSSTKNKEDHNDVSLKNRNERNLDQSRNIASTTENGKSHITTPEVQSPCDELFSSFFTTPKAEQIRSNDQSRSSISTSDNRSSYAANNSLGAPFGKESNIEINKNDSLQRRSTASHSITTSFGVRRPQLGSRRALSRTDSDSNSITSYASSSNLDYSRRASDNKSNGQNPSGTDSDETTPKTPSDERNLEKGMLQSSSYDDKNTDSSNVSSEFLDDPSSTNEGNNWPTMSDLPSPNEEKKKWQIFNQGGIIEPPEANESSSISSAEISRANAAAASNSSNNPIRPKVGINHGPSSNSQTSSRFTSMTSSRFLSSQSIVSTAPTEMEIHDDGKRFVMDSRRNVSKSEKESKNSISIAKQLALRKNSVTLVPSGDDGRTFVFVSNTNLNDQPGLKNALLKDGHSV